VSRRTRAFRPVLTLAVALLSVCSAGQQTPPATAPAAASANPATDQNPLGQNIVDAFRQAGQPENISTSLLIVFLLTILTLAPAILVMTTSFTRIIVVFGFLRQAMATQQSPPNQVLIGIALFLTFFIMAPTYQRVYDEAVQPYIQGEIPTITEAYDKALVPMREFMFRQLENNPRDIALFMQIAKLERPKVRADIPTTVLVPAFILNEMRISFQIGFIIYIPFLIIDMVVASTLMAMGMMMLPPVFVSLPFKIIMFVLADGWMLLIGSLVRSFG
jgi:flagellar biosynthetic protein FliP